MKRNAKLAITVLAENQYDISEDMRLVTDLGIECKCIPLEHSQDAKLITEALNGYEYVIAGSERYDDETLSLLPDLKLIVRNGVGYDSVDLEAAARHGVAVCNLPGSNAYSVAEHVLGMMICVVRHIPQHTQSIKNGVYAARMTLSMSDIRIGLMGLGAIAKELAKLLRVFDVEVVGYDPYMTTQQMAEYSVKKVELDELISTSDIISLHMPVTKETKGMVNAEFISRMKDGAYFINAARGALVDENALADGLRSGKLGGAGLDVFDPEPIIPGNPLLEIENILLSPHGATANIRCFHTVLGCAAKAVSDFHKGEEPYHLLNPNYTKNAK